MWREEYVCGERNNVCGVGPSKNVFLISIL
jgi:hypothetical protein